MRGAINNQKLFRKTWVEWAEQSFCDIFNLHWCTKIGRNEFPMLFLMPCANWLSWPSSWMILHCWRPDEKDRYFIHYSKRLHFIQLLVNSLICVTGYQIKYQITIPLILFSFVQSLNYIDKNHFWFNASIFSCGNGIWLLVTYISDQYPWESNKKAYDHKYIIFKRSSQNEPFGNWCQRMWITFLQSFL